MRFITYTMKVVLSVIIKEGIRGSESSTQTVSRPIKPLAVCLMFLICMVAITMGVIPEGVGITEVV